MPFRWTRNKKKKFVIRLTNFLVYLGIFLHRHSIFTSSFPSAGERSHPFDGRLYNLFRNYSLLNYLPIPILFYKVSRLVDECCFSAATVIRIKEAKLKVVVLHSARSIGPPIICTVNLLTIFSLFFFVSYFVIKQNDLINSPDEWGCCLKEVVGNKEDQSWWFATKL